MIAETDRRALFAVTLTLGPTLVVAVGARSARRTLGPMFAGVLASMFARLAWFTMLARRAFTVTLFARRPGRPVFARCAWFGRGQFGRCCFGSRFAMRARLTRLAARSATAFSATAGAAAASAATATAATTSPTIGRLERQGIHARYLDARDGGADQLLDGLDQSALGRIGQRKGMAGLAGPAGTTDAMDVVLG